MLDESGLRPDVFAAPEGVDVYRRVGGDHEIFIVENVGPHPQTVALPAPMKDLFTGETVRSVTLPTYGVAVLSKSRSQM